MLDLGFVKDYNVIVRFIDLPYAVRGFVKESSDGIYNVYLNSRYCYSQNIKTLIHELKHIRNGDLNSLLSAHEIERRANDGSCEKIS